MMVGELVDLRKAAGLSQTSMADWMGLSLRAYQAIENDAPDMLLSRRHQYMAESATLQIAVDRANPMLTTEKVRGLALDLATLIRG